MTTPIAGWYPDPEDARRLRWWNGVGWADSYSEYQAPGGSAAIAPMATMPYDSYYRAAASADPKAPEGTGWNTVWIWLIIFVPILPSLGLFTIDWSQFFDLSNPSEMSSLRMITSPGYLFMVASGWIVYGLTAWFAYLDYRELVRRQVPRPFHWAWVFLSSSVYPIGRSVVVRRRTGSGIAPMWVSIAILAAMLVLGIVFTVYIMSMVFTQISEIPFQPY